MLIDQSRFVPDQKSKIEANPLHANFVNARISKVSGSATPPYKGTCQKRFSGIRPLRGGGYPPFPLRKKTFFFSH